MKVRYLLIIAIVLGLISIVALRSNSQQVARIRADILEKDKQGQSVSSELSSLRKFVFTHMNASIKFELSGSYERAAEQAKQASQAHASGDVYEQAQAACGQEVGTNSVAQVQCVQSYLETHLQTGDNPQPVALPDRSLYTYSFVSPTWSGDIAGWTLLGALLLGISALVVYVRQSFNQPA